MKLRYLFSLPLLLGLSYFWTSLVFSVFSGRGFDKLFENSNFVIGITLFFETLLFFGISYVIYIFVRNDRIEQRVLLSGLAISTLYHALSGF